MGHLYVGKPALMSGLGIFEVCSLCRVSGCALWFAQFVSLFPGTSREPRFPLNAGGTWQDKVRLKPAPARLTALTLQKQLLALLFALYCSYH